MISKRDNHRGRMNSLAVRSERKHRRVAAVKALREEGFSIKEIALKMNISTQTVRRAIALSNEKGV